MATPPSIPSPAVSPARTAEAQIKLPAVAPSASMALVEALRKRRSVRQFAPQALALGELSALLWAAQGITDPSGLRATPSAGGLYPLALYVVVGRVEGLTSGVYRYEPSRHALAQVTRGDRRRGLARAALEQRWMATAPATVVLTAAYPVTTGKYGARGRRYVQMEVGCAAENIYLMATALGLGTTMVGAFEDDRVVGVIGHPTTEKPLALMPIGRVQ